MGSYSQKNFDDIFLRSSSGLKGSNRNVHEDDNEYGEEISDEEYTRRGLSNKHGFYRSHRASNIIQISMKKVSHIHTMIKVLPFESIQSQRLTKQWRFNNITNHLDRHNACSG